MHQKKEDGMGDHVFRSKFTIEEIDDNFKNINLFCGLKESLEKVLAYEKSKPKTDISAKKTGNTIPVKGSGSEIPSLQ